MTDMQPILTFPSRFEETEQSYTQRQWSADQSCLMFWQSFLKENEDTLKYEFLSDDVVVKHWFYCSACCPNTNIYSDKDEFMAEIKSGYAGDIFEIWTLSDTPKYYMFKCPDVKGNTPGKGAY